MRILIVDDELLIAQLLETTLNLAGHKVVGIVGSIKRALEAIKTAEFDAAIVDINLNGVFASEIVEALRLRGVKFIIATGYAPEQLPFQRGGEPILGKPFDDDELFRAMNQLAA
jgi:CheY-like chemotaxis protein